jgi:hypothetical protein
MTEVVLPEDGAAVVAGIALPAGQKIYGMGAGQPSFYEDAYDPAVSGAPVAWVTSAPMADAGDAWLALSAAHQETGLVPVLLSRAWNMSDDISGDAFGLWGPEDVGLIDAIDPRMVLASGWDLVEEEYQDPYLLPYRGRFPGLAPSQQTRLSDGALREAVSTEQPAFLGLVPANCPADVPAAVGWSVFGTDRPGGAQARSLQIAAVLRSWESRFGARLLRLGSDSILRILVGQPPATLEDALAVAAEHLAFADEYGRYAGQPIRELAAELIRQPIWHFWWDLTR